MTLSQAGQLVSRPEEGAGEADDSGLPRRGNTRCRQQGGQVKGGHVQGKEARTKHNAGRVKAGAVEEEVFDCFRDSPVSRGKVSAVVRCPCLQTKMTLS